MCFVYQPDVSLCFDSSNQLTLTIRAVLNYVRSVGNMLLLNLLKAMPLNDARIKRAKHFLLKKMVKSFEKVKSEQKKADWWYVNFLLKKLRQTFILSVSFLLSQYVYLLLLVNPILLIRNINYLFPFQLKKFTIERWFPIKQAIWIHSTK